MSSVLIVVVFSCQSLIIQHSQMMMFLCFWEWVGLFSSVSEWRRLLFVLSVFWQSCPVTDTLVSLFVSAGTRVSITGSRHKHESHQELSYFTAKSKYYLAWKNFLTLLFTLYSRKWNAFYPKSLNAKINVFCHFNIIYILHFVFLYHGKCNRI